MSPNTCYLCSRSVHGCKGWGIVRRAITVASRGCPSLSRSNRWDIAGFSGTMAHARSDGWSEGTTDTILISEGVTWEVMGT